MVDTKPGKILKQGPIATLEGGLSFSENDRFMFNGDQFVHYVAKTPKVIEASANAVVSYSSGDFEVSSNSNFKTPSGEFRFVDGDPVYQSGTYIDAPTSEYDHVVVGYQSPVTTSEIKFWSEDFIPVEYIRVDRGYDSDSFINIPTHAGNVTFVFDDSIKVYESEDSPQGQYIYTIDLGGEFTAKYWRIRSFIYSLSVENVDAPVLGKDVELTTTSGLPSSISDTGNFYIFTDGTESDSSTLYKNGYWNEFSFGSVEEYGDGFVVRDVVIDDGLTGTIRVGSYFKMNSNYGSASWSWLVEDVEKALPSQTLDLYVSTMVWQVGWPGWTRLTLDYDVTSRTSVKYASLSGNTLETINPVYYADDEILYAGRPFVYTYPMKITQVRILENVGPQLKYWESDGSLSVTNLVSVSDIYDIVYDDSDDVYYGIRFDLGGGQGNPRIADDFSFGVGSYFDTNRWILDGTAFTRDYSTECLSFLTGSGVYYSGNLVSACYFTDSFTANLNTVVTNFSGTGNFGLTLMDNIYNNQVAGEYIVGDWGTISGSSFWGTISGSSIVAISTSDYINATDSIVTLANTALDPYNILEGTNKHTFSYVTSSGWYYSRENKSAPGEDEVYEVFSSTSSYVSGGGFSCSLEDNGETVSDGSYVSFYTVKSTSSGINDHNVSLGVVYFGTTNEVEFSYNDGSDVSVLQTSFESSVTSSNFKVGIVGVNNNFTTISATSIDTTGNLEWPLSCFEVVAMDVEGNRTSVAGVSDANGSVITTLDIIDDPSKVYGDYYNTISIATTNTSESAGGSLFVRVGDDIYKYNKTTLPLSEPEKGTNASVLASGVSMHEDIKHFQYDDYSVGGLSYIYSDSDRGGRYLAVIDAGTLETTSYGAELDISNHKVPFARDVSDISVLYSVVGGDVYVFNASEEDASFCNVVSNITILPASSDYSTTVTAIVTNIFGVPLQNKTVTFSVTAGGGSLSSATDCTSSSGTASTTFIASSVVGTSYVTATASNDVC